MEWHRTIPIEPIKGLPMSVRYNMVVSDELDREIERVVSETESNKSEIFRKALQLFIAARESKAKGQKFGFVNSETNLLETEVIGL
jgi:metal-responsive CopG/Arc/MetJ family transcriptional regulator